MSAKRSGSSSLSVDIRPSKAEVVGHLRVLLEDLQQLLMYCETSGVSGYLMSSLDGRPVSAAVGVVELDDLAARAAPSTITLTLRLGSLRFWTTRGDDADL